MKRFGVCSGFAGGTFAVLILGFNAWAGQGGTFPTVEDKFTAVEDKFDSLQIGTQVLTNVTVTTKAKGYVFLHHAHGLTSVKVAELPADVREHLGYDAKTKAKSVSSTASAWAHQTMAKLDLPQIKAVEQQLRHTWSDQVKGRLPAVGSGMFFAFLGVLVLMYLFFSYCCQLICRKTGQDPGPLVWLPILQQIPLLRAAGMSPWWFFIPVLWLVVGIMWPFKIVKARGKSPLVGLMLLVPGVNLVAFLYLAFSDPIGPKEPPVIEMMTLETV